MLVLSRKKEESVVAPLSPETLQRLLDEHPNGCQIRFHIVKLTGSTATVGTEAPSCVPVYRQELLDKNGKPLPKETVLN